MWLFHVVVVVFHVGVLRRTARTCSTIIIPHSTYQILNLWRYRGAVPVVDAEAVTSRDTSSSKSYA